jgi:hypothetical protein
MKTQEMERIDAMGLFHNEIVELVDRSDLTPPETIAVLRAVANSIEGLFVTEVKNRKD